MNVIRLCSSTIQHLLFSVNLALDENTSQPSTSNGGVSERAVDGDTNGEKTVKDAEKNEKGAAKNNEFAENGEKGW